MIKKAYFYVFLLSSLLLLSFTKKETYSLTVNVNELRNSKGVVLFTLYNKEGSIPDKKQTNYYKKLTGSITSSSSTIIFSDLPKGKYAVNIIHDENNNGEIDMGYFLPKEGIGFSNFKKLNIMNRPAFSRASFNLNNNLSIKIKTIYM